MKVFNSDNNGVTLMELIIAMTIVGFIVIAVITYNLIGEKYFQSTSRQAMVLNDAQYLVRKIGQDLKEASSAPSFSSNRLSINSGHIIYYLEGETIYYSNDTLEPPVSDEALADNVKLFDVVVGIPRKIATLTISVQIGEEKDEEVSSHKAEFYMRNM